MELKQQKSFKSQRGRPLKPKPSAVDPLAVAHSSQDYVFVERKTINAVEMSSVSRERRSTRRKQTWTSQPAVEKTDNESPGKRTFGPMQRALQGLCRVCAGSVKQVGGMDVFGTEGKLDALEGKIFRFLPIVVSTLDTGMPRQVCGKCVKQLAKFQAFYEATSKADTRLRDMLSSKTSTKTKVKTQSLIPSFEEWPPAANQQQIRTNEDKCESNQDEEEDNTITVCISPDSMAVRVRPEDEDMSCDEKDLSEDMSMARKLSVDQSSSKVSDDEPPFKKLCHNNEDDFNCQICDRSFQNFSVLQDHYSRIHSTHLCNICAPLQNYFNSEEALLNHIRSIHT